jgi:hypothetical protein
MEFIYGDTFKNNYMPDYNFRVERQDKEKNILEVCITGGNDSRWFEDWNLAHTIVGFNQGVYHSVTRKKNF